MKTAVKHCGPYVSPSGKTAGRKYMQVFYDNGSHGTTLYSRYLMEQSLGRKLDLDETVDHIDEDITNDVLSNLRILSRVENAKLWAANNRSIEMMDFVCMCGAGFERQARYYRSNQIYQGKSGPYCSRSCAGRYTHWSL